MKCSICGEAKRTYRRLSPRQTICRVCYRKVEDTVRSLISRHPIERQNWQRYIQGINRTEAIREYRRTHNGESPPPNWSPQGQPETPHLERSQPARQPNAARKRFRRFILRKPADFLSEVLTFDDLIKTEKKVSEVQI
jgi:hypothetical protein